MPFDKYKNSGPKAPWNKQRKAAGLSGVVLGHVPSGNFENLDSLKCIQVHFGEEKCDFFQLISAQIISKIARLVLYAQVSVVAEATLENTKISTV